MPDYTVETEGVAREVYVVSGDSPDEIREWSEMPGAAA